jgi:hypothetical protein
LVTGWRLGGGTCRGQSSDCGVAIMRVLSWLAMLAVGCVPSHVIVSGSISLHEAQQIHLAPCYVSPWRPSSSANFQSIFNASLQEYDNKTKNNLLDHPLAAHLQSCDSPNAVLTVLQDLVQKFDQRRASDDKLNNWLNPTVNVLYAFSNTLGEGVSLVSPNSRSLYDLCSNHHP